MPDGTYPFVDVPRRSLVTRPTRFSTATFFCTAARLIG